MQIVNEWSISPEFKIAEVDNFPENVFQKLVKENLLHSYPALEWRKNLSTTEKELDESLKNRVKDLYKLRLVVFYREDIVGLTLGWQMGVSHSDFYMAISVIDKAFRLRGLYSQLLDKVLIITKKHGFSAVTSRHINTNNPVIIAKLKKGFIINGFEMDEVMGSLLKMTYYHNEVRKKAADFRAGNIINNPTLELLTS